MEEAAFELRFNEQDFRRLLLLVFCSLARLNWLSGFNVSNLCMSLRILYGTLYIIAAEIFLALQNYF